MPRIEDKAGGSGTQQQTASRVNGVRKKERKLLTQLPGCFGDYRGGHRSAGWHLKLPQNRLCFPRGVGVDPPPDVPIKLAGSSHTSRQRECLVSWLWMDL